MTEVGPKGIVRLVEQRPMLQDPPMDCVLWAAKERTG